MKVVTATLKWATPLVPLDLKKVFHVVLHHIAAAAATSEQLHRWHLDRKWKGAAYNEYIRKDGTVVILRGDHIGGHTENNNSKTYGIALEGNYDIEKEIPKAQMDALIERLRHHKKRMPNDIKIVPHSYFSKTACPGKHVNVPAIVAAMEQQSNTDQEFYAAIELFGKHKVINSPMYWLDNAKAGATVKGEHARQLILNMAKVLRG